MDHLLLECNKNLETMPCCHKDKRVCNCYNCLKGGFFEGQDSYNCKKKLSYYVVNYGPSFASELYHYFDKSHILETLSARNSGIKILSLGCGFAPDLVAISKYLEMKTLSINYTYHGIDLSQNWDCCRYTNKYATFSIDDVLSNITLENYDLIFVTKLFSTLKKNKQHLLFRKTLIDAISTQMLSESVLVFCDINSKWEGRDLFDNYVENEFNSVRRYCFTNPKYTPSNCTVIQNTDVVFKIPNGLKISPLMSTTNVVCFEYTK